MEAPETVASEAAPEAPDAQKPRGSLLRERNFRLFFTGQLISNSGTFLQSVAQGVLVFKLTHRSFMVGVTQAAVFIPVMLLSLTGGSLADRFDRRRLLIASQVLAMVATGTLAIVVTTGHANVGIVIAVASLVGVQYAVAIPTSQALLPAFVEPRRLGEAIGLNSVTFNVARVIGPALSTALLAAAGFGLAFGLNSLSFLALIGALMLITFRRPPRAHAESRSVRDALVYAWRRPRVRLLLLGALVLALAVDPLTTLAPAIASEVFHRPRSDAGLILAAFGFGSMSAAFLFVGLLRARSAVRYRLLPWLMALFGAGVIGFVWMPSFGVALVVLAIGGLGFLTSTTTLVTGLQEEVVESMRGRIMGIWTLCALGSRPLAALVDGVVADLAGPRIGVLVIAAPLVVFAILGAPRLRVSAAAPALEPA
jgi:MFS family permease